MLRLVIVLPIVLGLTMGLPLTEPYQAFAAWISRFTIDVWLHLAAYGLSAVTAGLLIWRMERAWMPRLVYSPWFGAVATLRAGLISVLIMAAMQLFYWFTQGQFDVLPLFAPAIFIVAEAAFDTTDGLLRRRRRLRAERIAAARGDAHHRTSGPGQSYFE